MLCLLAMPPVNPPNNQFSKPPLTDPNLDYSFIMQHGTPPPRRGQRSPTSQKQRLLIAGGGFLTLIFVIIGFFAYLQSQGRRGAVEFNDLANYQSEIVRVAAIGVEKGSAIATRNYAQSVNQTVGSDLNTSVGILAGLGYKVSAQTLVRYQSSQTDTQLDNAEKNNSFDSTFISVMADELSNYRQKISATYPLISSQKAKDALKAYDTNAKTLSSGLTDN